MQILFVLMTVRKYRNSHSCRRIGVTCFTYLSSTADSHETRRLRKEIVTREAEPSLALPLLFTKLTLMGSGKLILIFYSVVALGGPFSGGTHSDS